jgi:hypothetical protein
MPQRFLMPSEQCEVACGTGYQSRGINQLRHGRGFITARVAESIRCDLLSHQLDRWDEWHLDFHKTFCHEEFHFGARPHQPAVVIAATFFYPGLEAIRSISHLMRGDGIE